jgi:hypothetical protein
MMTALSTRALSECEFRLFGGVEEEEIRQRSEETSLGSTRGACENGSLKECSESEMGWPDHGIRHSTLSTLCKLSTDINIRGIK